MNTINSPLKLLLINATFGVALVTSWGFAQTAVAQFTSPPGQGTPKGSAGGGTRPSHPFCTQSASNADTLVALAPTTAIGLTTHSHPTVWVYVPQTTAKTLEFSLLTKEQEGVYQTNLPLKAAGLVKITLPANIVLRPNQPYNWQVALVCNPQRRTEDWVVGGWIQQRPFSPDLQRQLAGATVEQQLKLYTQFGFWYEALNTYLGLRQTQPENPRLVSLWTELLSSAGLNKMTPALATQSTQ